MRLRWIIIPVLLVLTTAAVYGICYQPAGAIATVVGLARLLTYGILMAVGFWSASVI